MCTVVVALTSTSVLVTVLVKVSVAVVLPASTEVGTSSATSAVAVVVKRICKDCGGSQPRRCWWDATGYMPTECVKTVVAVRALIKSILLRFLSFLSSLAGSRPGGCFNCVLLELQGMAWDGGSVKRCRWRVPEKRVVERALLEMLGTFCAEKMKLRSLHILRVKGRSPAKSGSTLYQGCDRWSHVSRVCVPQR